MEGTSSEGLKEVNGYESLPEAYECAELLKEHGIECRLSHRERGLFGDTGTSNLTWISVPQADYERAMELLFPPVEEEDVELQLQCPLCKSLKVRFEVLDPKTGLSKLITWPWDKEIFYCDNCRHSWDRVPED